MPKTARAAGFIVFRISNRLEYLLLQASSDSAHWGPPKGHLDEGEDAFAAAKRETHEEAGLPPNSYDVMEGSDFPYVLEYPVNGKPKKVEYWVAYLKNPETPIKLSDEHINFRWGDLQQSKDLVKPYPDFQRLLDKTEAFLLSSFNKK